MTEQNLWDLYDALDDTFSGGLYSALTGYFRGDKLGDMALLGQVVHVKSLCERMERLIISTPYAPGSAQEALTAN